MSLLSLSNFIKIERKVLVVQIMLPYSYYVSLAFFVMASDFFVSFLVLNPSRHNSFLNLISMVPSLFRTLDIISLLFFLE